MSTPPVLGAEPRRRLVPHDCALRQAVASARIISFSPKRARPSRPATRGPR